MKKLFIILFSIIFTNIYSQHNIIPNPVDYKATGSTFVFEDNISFDLKYKNDKIVQYTNDFKSYLKAIGVNIKNKNSKFDKKIIVDICKPYNNELSKEGYLLKIENKQINIQANTEAGIFYAFQSLKQLLPSSTSPSKNNKLQITTCIIKDYPRFGWRGLMLDVSRHFFTVDEVKKYIDKMAEYKFNVLHWHLTDDDGWRIEIKSLPKLTEIGAWRVQRYGRFGKNRQVPQKGEATSYGGFYTQEQIKDIVQYAENKNINILPEIDMPGHSMAALAAYPELSTGKEPKYVNPGAKFAEWYTNGRFEMLIENTLNPSDEKVYEFADKVFKEVATLFPFQYIHMGGDECYHGFWEKNQNAKKFMEKNNIKNGHELQSYFVERIGKIINKH